LKEAFKIIEDMNISQDEWRAFGAQDRHYYSIMAHGIQSAIENAEDFCRGQERETSNEDV